jgi:ATP-dependent Lon protease
MEIINISGYTDEEKVMIAKKFLIPRQLEENGITKENLKLADKAILMMISHYTQESGLRNLEREIAAVCRKVARSIAENKHKQHRITADNHHKYLGVPKYLPEVEQEISQVGVATGLAWTQAGGEVLHVEATTMKGKGNLTLTGHLGDVMKESAQAAMSFARSKAKELKINPGFNEKLDLHIHVPAGAIPKDGPSAGVTMATAVISSLTKTPVKKDVAMTGEITLRGRILPVGGLKEKSLGAIRAKIKTMIVPERNKKDLEEIPENIRKKLNYVFARSMDDVLHNALQNNTKKTTRKKKK